MCPTPLMILSYRAKDIITATIIVTMNLTSTLCSRLLILNSRFYRQLKRRMIRTRLMPLCRKTIKLRLLMKSGRLREKVSNLLSLILLPSSALIPLTRVFSSKSSTTGLTYLTCSICLRTSKISERIILISSWSAMANS